jgi:hypothetical protein
MKKFVTTLAIAAAIFAAAVHAQQVRDQASAPADESLPVPARR